MTQVEISLPEPLHVFRKRQRESGGCATVREYVQALLRGHWKRQERLEALLLEGLESGPATEMTDADGDEMRRRFDERS